MADEIDDDILSEDDELEDDEIEEEGEEEEEEETEESDEEGDSDEEQPSNNIDEALPQTSKKVLKQATKFTTKEQSYHELYQGQRRSNAAAPRMTKYELVAVLATRAAQIAEGAPTTVDAGDLRDPREIAKKELREGLCPLIIRRPIPGKQLTKPLYDYCRVSELADK